MTEHNGDGPAKFGTIIGMAPGGVLVFSCDYDSVDDSELPTRRAYRSNVDDLLLRSEVQVYELLWTLIPCNKANLPVLWS